MTLYVIMGPPCSGKSTWALERARPGDVVIDLDRIAVALSGSGAPTHGHDGAVDRCAWAARNAVMDRMAEERLYEDTDVYLIHSCPSVPTRNKYRRAGAELVTLDPGQEETVRRVKEYRPAESMRGVEKWYRSLNPRRHSRDW